MWPRPFMNDALERIQRDYYTRGPPPHDIVKEQRTWQEVALELAVVVNRQRIHRMNEDYLLGWELAREVLRLKDIVKNEY